MHQPATTNPLIIMCINMTIVFAVLIGLSFMIKFIHMIDPTKPKESRRRRRRRLRQRRLLRLRLLRRPLLTRT